MSTPSIIALIPARAGSTRVPGKNTRLLGGEPLWRWTYDAAIRSGIFDRTVIVTDDPNISGPAISRSPTSATATAPDILWVRDALAQIEPADAFAILRPTSPFRTAETIRRAWSEFLAHQPCDSLRAVEPVRQHPAKMWTLDETQHRLYPIMNYRHADGTPWHSSPTQTLRQVYVQNASLEIAWTRVVEETGTISGGRIMPFFTEGREGFDINTEADWADAERLLMVPA